MSRTYKDRPVRVRKPANHWRTWDDRHERIPYIAVRVQWDGEVTEHESYYRLEKEGPRKLKRTYDSEWHWTRSVPAWFTRMFMTRPQRSKCRAWEVKALKCLDFEELDTPLGGKKPHVYYW